MTRSVDGRSKWRAGTRETEVGLDGLCEGMWPWAIDEWRWRLRVSARKIGKSGEPWYICHWMSFTRPFLLGPVLFRTALPCSGGDHLERGGMPLPCAVGINCKNGINYWKSRPRCQVYGLRGVCWWLCVYIIWLDMTTSPWWSEKVMVYYTTYLKTTCD